MMRHAGAYAVSGTEERPEADSIFERTATFDRDGTFELRYLRYRRYNDQRKVLQYDGELEDVLHPPQRPAGP
jgi:hypothetical protein